MNSSYIRINRLIKSLNSVTCTARVTRAMKLDLVNALSTYDFFVGKDDKGNPCHVNLYKSLFEWLDPKLKTLCSINLDVLSKSYEELDTLDFVQIASEVLSVKSVNFRRFSNKLLYYVKARCKYRDVIMIGLSFGKYCDVFTYQMWDVSDNQENDNVMNYQDIVKEVVIHLMKMKPTAHDIHNLRIEFKRLAPGPGRKIER